MTERYVTPNPERFRLFRLCDCPTCEGRGQVILDTGPTRKLTRCADCRGEGRVRQEIATCAAPESVGVALVTLAREGEWDECPFGLLDTEPECEKCGGRAVYYAEHRVCSVCMGSGVKPTGTWLIRPWLPSARNVSDAARTLAKSKRTS